MKYYLLSIYFTHYKWTDIYFYSILSFISNSILYLWTNYRKYFIKCTLPHIKANEIWKIFFLIIPLQNNALVFQ